MTAAQPTLEYLTITTAGLELRSPSLDDLQSLAGLAVRQQHDVFFQSAYGQAWVDASPDAYDTFEAAFISRSRAREPFRRPAERSTTCVGDMPRTAWSIDLAVVIDGRPIGVQGIEFTYRLHPPTRLMFSTYAWLAPERRGKGYGTMARAAMLAFAFDHLGVTGVATGARSDNEPSLAVTRKLGYRPTGSVPTNYSDGVHLQHTYVLSASEWQLHRDRWPAVDVAGAEDLAFFVTELREHTRLRAERFDAIGQADTKGITLSGF